MRYWYHGVLLSIAYLSASSVRADIQTGEPNNVDVAAEHSNSEKIYVDIPAQPLAQALILFSLKYKRIIVAQPLMLKPHISSGIRGDYSAYDALQLMLKGTNLDLEATKSDGFIVIDTPPPLSTSTPDSVQTKQEPAIEEVFSFGRKMNSSLLNAAGIRGSLQRAMDVKRNTSGVVDATSAENMGKFPDANLAESLQRITGVSINRVNGEGSEVTIRGFSGGFNLVTLNGRQMPAANVGSITGNPVDQEIRGSSRSFDFSKLASEGVSGLQVYKTGRASVATGGVGATINVQTVKPLELGASQGSVGVKLVNDVSGDEITPELSGLYSWTNDEGNFGAAVFGSYQKRNSGSRHASVEQYSIRAWDNTDPDNLGNFGLVDDVSISNEPDNGQYVVRPSNLGLGTNEDSRERINGQLIVQYAPAETLTITVDALYAVNSLESTSLVDGIWFTNTVDTIVYDGNPVVAAPELFAEDVNGGKDFFFQNLSLGTKDTLRSIGFNADFQVSDILSVAVDYATSEAKSGPDGPMGKNVIRLNIAGVNAGWQAADFSQDIPQAMVSIDDTETSGTPDGIFNAEDVGSQYFLTNASQQISKIDQFNIDSTYDVSDNLKVDFGLGVMNAEMLQTRTATQDELGGWGVSTPGDIPSGLLEQDCTICDFDHGATGVQGVSQPIGETAPISLGSISWRIDPKDGVNAITSANPDYGVDPQNLNITSTDNNRVEEDIFSVYAQIESNNEFFGMAASLVFGARYERTNATATSVQGVQSALNWIANNDFIFDLDDETIALVDDYSYDNLLPSIDFSLNITDDLKARASYSKTIARPQYGDMYTATTLNIPEQITYLGGSPTANLGSVRLAPLESTNVDFSVEYYYGDANYVSIGYYHKDVANFIRPQQSSEPLFGLRDATTSDSMFLFQAINELALVSSGAVAENADTLFSMTAITQNLAEFQANGNNTPNATPAEVYETELGLVMAGGGSEQSFHENISESYNVTPVPTDPLIQFLVSSPTNSQNALIDGFEVAAQHFFGESGFGYQANFTTVEGDISYDNGGNPNVDQFALPGLSNSANVVLIFEKFGFSGRLAYNWRDEFLNQVNRPVGSTRNPEYVDAVEQIDLNVSYEFDFGLSLAFDAINLTSEGQRKFGRTKAAVFFVQELDPRYTLSARYSF